MKIANKLVEVNIKKNQIFVQRILSMYRALDGSGSILGPSKMWQELDGDSMVEARIYGFENFKRTLTRHYFANTPIWFLNRQTQFLVFNTNPFKTFKYLLRSIFSSTHEPFSWIDSASYTFLTYMIWEYTKKYDKEDLLEKFHESPIGNPPPIFIKSKLISQDIANSVLEFKSIFQFIQENEVSTILEIGAGSGRNAIVMVKLLKSFKKYIIIDLPPALATAERYLSELFPQKKTFKYREFTSFEKIKKEFNNAHLVFLLPHQIYLLPKEIVDLTINISSLHEMKLKQIREYFKQVERLTKKNKYFYFKEWKIAGVTHENEIIKVEDYPVKKWKTIFMRTPKVQIKFFERLLQLK